MLQPFASHMDRTVLSELLLLVVLIADDFVLVVVVCCSLLSLLLQPCVGLYTRVT